ncbi:MAG: hypothetical protein IJG00_00830, partial [Clostridia bacterium]|nr:hypothetical protein [Clostridia bacterium]
NENMSKRYYILKSTKKDINTIISEYLNAIAKHADSFHALDDIKGFDPKKLKKVETNAHKKQTHRPPMPLPPNKT